MWKVTVFTALGNVKRQFQTISWSSYTPILMNYYTKQTGKWTLIIWVKTASEENQGVFLNWSDSLKWENDK